MLILTRRRKELIRIGDNILVSLNDIRGNQVSMGIDAPKDQNIRREERVFFHKENATPEQEKKVKILIKKSKLKLIETDCLNVKNK